MLSLIFLKLLNKTRQYSKLLFLSFTFLIINSCSLREQNILQPSKFKFINENIFQFSFAINIKNYSILEKNLIMFSMASININLSFFSIGKQFLSSKKIERKIIYDRWNKTFIIKSSYNNKIVKYKKFEELIKNVFAFNNIKIDFTNKNFKDDRVLLRYDFILKSTDLAPPFNLVEYDLRFGNIKRTNQKIILKITN